MIWLKLGSLVIGLLQTSTVGFVCNDQQIEEVKLKYPVTIQNARKALNFWRSLLVLVQERVMLNLEKQNTISVYELKICASFIPTESNNRSNKTMIEVTLPSGYVAGQDPASVQTRVTPKQITPNSEQCICSQSFVIRYGGTQPLLRNWNAIQKYEVDVLQDKDLEERLSEPFHFSPVSAEIGHELKPNLEPVVLGK
uniref:Phosphatidylinositol-glycan biosynthesis class X protein n=1 Tax=Anopheles minimus TaxID=112268 RepID=A0A182W8U1_9DIPT